MLDADEKLNLTFVRYRVLGEDTLRIMNKERTLTVPRVGTSPVDGQEHVNF